MAFPVVEQVVENSTNTAGTNHTINLPTATAGELLLIILDKGSTSATVNAHGSLTELLDEASANGLYIAYRWMDGTEPASYTLVTSANTRTASFAYRISGAANPATTAPQIGTTSSGTSATPDPPASAAPPSTKDYLFITFYGAAGEEADDDTWSDTPPTNYSPTPPRQKACGTAGTNLGGLIAAAERQLNTGAAENPGTFAKDVSAAWRAQTITIHPTLDVTLSAGGNTIDISAPDVTIHLLVPAGANTINVSAPDVTVHLVIPAGANTILVSAPTAEIPVILSAGANTINVSAPTAILKMNHTLAAGDQTVNISAPTATLKVGIENKRNIILFSEDFSDDFWSKNNNGGFTGADLTYNAETAPDGTNTATFLKEDDTGLFHNMAVFSNDIPFSHDRQFVNVSCHFKLPASPGLRKFAYIAVYDFSAGSTNRNFLFAGFYLQGGGQLIDDYSGLAVDAYYQDVSSGGPHVKTIEALPNGWYRCSVGGFLEKPESSMVAIEIGLGKEPEGVPGSQDAEQFFDWLGNDTSGIYVWGVQVEEYRNKSIYTKTVGAPVTNDILTFGPTQINVSAPTATIDNVTFTPGTVTINVSAPDATGIFDAGGTNLSAGANTVNISAPDVTVHLTIPAGGNTINVSAPEETLLVETTLAAGLNQINVSAPEETLLVETTLAAGQNTVNLSAPATTQLVEITLAAGLNQINVSAPAQTVHLLIPAGLVEISISAPDALLQIEGGPITLLANQALLNVSAPEVTVHLTIPAGLNQINVSAPTAVPFGEVTLPSGGATINVSAPDATGLFGGGETTLSAGENIVNLSAPQVTIHLTMPVAENTVLISAPDASILNTFDTIVLAGGVVVQIFAPIHTLKQTFPFAITKQAHDAHFEPVTFDVSEFARETQHDARSARNVEDTQVVIST